MTSLHSDWDTVVANYVAIVPYNKARAQKLVHMFHEWVASEHPSVTQLDLDLCDEFMALHWAQALAEKTRTSYHGVIHRYIRWRAGTFGPPGHWSRLTRDDLPVPATVSQYLAAIAPNRRESTCKRYRNILREFHDWLQSRHVEMALMTRDDAVEYLRWLHDLGRSIATRRQIIVVVRGYLRHLAVREHLVRHPDAIFIAADMPKLPLGVTDGIEAVYRGWGKRAFGFTDLSYEDAPRSPFGTRIRAIASEILARGLELTYSVDLRASFGRRATDDLMQVLLQSGLTVPFIGIESGHEADLRLFCKDSTVSDNRHVLDFFKAYGINPLMGFLSFHPYSSLDSLRDNLAFLHDTGYGGELFFTYKLILYRNVAIFDKAAADGLLLPSARFEEHPYRFVDERIGPLASFLREQFFAEIGNSLVNDMLHLFHPYKSTGSNGFCG